MRPLEPTFAIVYNGNEVMVREHELAGRRVFYVDLKTPQRPLIITVGLDRKDIKFWTSIPEGRQEEAEQIGKLIAAYIRNKK